MPATTPAWCAVPAPRSVQCVPAADGNAGCATEHTTPPDAPGKPPVPGLPNTGALLPWGMGLAALLLIACGGVLTITEQRKAASRARQQIGTDKF